MTYPKIELHVHLEGTVRPGLLLRIARRNDVRLPVRTERELHELYRFRDFRHSIEIYTLTVHALRTERDFREVVCAYAAEAKAHGPEISVIGVGAWAAGGAEWGRQDEKDSIDAITRAVAQGVNWVDTAPTYGLGFSEELVGRAIALLPPGDRPMVFTKCSRVWDVGGAVRSELSPASLRRECEASLTRLGVEVIDLYQIHQPAPEADLEQGWETLIRLRDEGKVRHIGVSNFSVAQLERLRRIEPVESLQPPYSLIDRRIEGTIVPYCRRHEIGVIVWSPLMRGLLAGHLSRHAIATLPLNDTRRDEPEFQEPRLSPNLALVQRLRRVARRHGRTPAQMAIAWTLRDPLVTGAIVGMRSAEQAQSIAAAATIELDDDDLDELTA